MSTNRDLSVARRYHEATKHTVERLRQARVELDWPNQPLPYKIYSSLSPWPLPADFEPSPLPALEALASPATPPVEARAPDLASLARLCFYANGVTRRLRRGGQEIAFRAAPCTGALYHIELYLVAGDLRGLTAGVYHYGAHDHGLRRLREGDYRAILVDACGSEPAVAAAPAVAVLTSTFWRNAWKYRARAYRHSFWDSGVIIANLLAVASALGLPAKLVLGFTDAEINRLLDVDGEREAAVALIALGHSGQPIPTPSPPIGPLALPTVPLSRTEISFPEIVEAHRASSLPSGRAAADWRGEPPPLPQRPPRGTLVPLAPLDAAQSPWDPIERVIQRRGSSRRFLRRPIGHQALSTLLRVASHPIPADFLGSDGRPLSYLYLIVNAVEGLAPGAYVFRPDVQSLELLRSGDLRSLAGELALWQELGADAAVDLYFVTDLDPILERFGNRGYRAAQIDAAARAGRLYLAAYALGLGATGLTFLDDEVTRFFSPHLAGMDVLFLLAIGVPAPRTGG